MELNEVGFYENENGHFVRTTLPGSSREATLRREKTGRISLYATYQYQLLAGLRRHGRLWLRRLRLRRHGRLRGYPVAVATAPPRPSISRRITARFKT
ncbi:MAG: hypothetical protein WKG07_10290 [Hymenobacter sp.]